MKRLVLFSVVAAGAILTAGAVASAQVIDTGSTTSDFGNSTTNTGTFQFGGGTSGSTTGGSTTGGTTGASQTTAGTSTTGGTTTRTTARVTSGQPGVAPTWLVTDPKELQAIIAAAKRKPPTIPADPAVVKSLVETASSGDSAAQQDAVHRIAELGESAIVPLVRIVREESTPPPQRAAAATLLVAFGSAAVPSMAPLIKSKSCDVRLMTVQALSIIGDRSSLAAIEIAAADSDENVRLAAVGTLGGLGLSSAVPALSKSLAKDKSLDVRLAAADALGQVACRSAVEPLVEAVTDHEVLVRRAATRALAGMGELLLSGTRGEIGKSKVGDALRAALDDADAQVRTAAAEGLGALKDERAAARLAAIVDDPEAGPTAIWSLGRIRSEESLAALQRLAQSSASETVRRAAAAALATAQRKP